MIIKKIIKLLFLISVFFLLNISSDTDAYLLDNEPSVANIFSASTLDLSIRDTTDNSFLISPIFNSTGIVPGYSQSKVIRIRKDGLEDFKYQFSALQITGDNDLCNSLNISVSLGGIVRYNGSLLGLNLTTPQNISSSGQDDWALVLSFNNNSSVLRGKSCDFSFVVRGWQLDSEETSGFQDTHTLNNSILVASEESNRSVIINEVMWMGSTGSSADEWIELRNTTDHDVDISKWILENSKDSSNRKLMISANKSIPAHGYFLIANYPKTSANSTLNVDVDEVANLELLNSNNGNIILKNEDGVIIDQAKGDSWPAGQNGTKKQSMERNDTPGDGLIAGSWHTCIDAGCNDLTYWDTEGNNYGTPKSANLSNEANINLIISEDYKTLGFKVFNISGFRKLKYLLTYETDTISDGVSGTVGLGGESEYGIDGIKLGTCSAGGTCTYYSGIHNMKIVIELEDYAGVTSILEKDL
ncbi:MAG: lamin tail domain-containing protein [Candidatus Daviesbacteria bacterium]|nr:lamin tail domain-containing protein [Candidatus Daviesbacteria bacterium]